MAPVDRVSEHLAVEGVAHEMVEHERAVSAASEAAASGVSPDNAVKSVLLREADFPDFELGAIPPLGEMLPAPEVVDRRVLNHEHGLCNAGDHTHSVLLVPREIVRVADARIADVCED